MTDPQVLDFSAPEEETLTIKFPDGKSCELPTADELTMPVFQFVAANGNEWQRLFEKADLTAAQRKRFDHLNDKLAYALCADVPRATVDLLSAKRKAKIIVGFMTASSDLLEAAKQAMNEKHKTSAR